MEMGMLDKRRGDAIIEAATEVRYLRLFPSIQGLYRCNFTLHRAAMNL